MKEALKNKNTDVDKMSGETSVYKQQYEQLLQEYNQYLEDLEALQSKAESLEKLKGLYEEEVAELKTRCSREKASFEDLSKRHEEVIEKVKKFESVSFELNFQHFFLQVNRYKEVS